MALPLIIFLFISYGYALIVLLFYLEIDQEPLSPEDFDQNPRCVSLVIPYKNEAENLSGLLDDLAGQSILPDLWEVILVDDHSSDDSASILEKTLDENLAFHFLSLPPGITGKKRALSYGIEHAKHDWIIQVDADCRLAPGFVSAHMSFLHSYPSDLVAGIVTTGRGSGTFIESFERLDILALAGTGAGSFALGRPMMCSGANLAYSKQLYEETRAFDPAYTLASGDDMFLMIGARKLGKTLSFIRDRESIVKTKPQNDLRGLIIQRVRWGAKTPRYNMPDIQLLALLVLLCNISMLLMPLWIILFSLWWPWLAGAWLLKTLADFMLLHKMTGITGSRSDLKLFLPVSLLYYPYFLLTVLGALRGRPVWK